MSRSVRHEKRTPDGRPAKITLGEMRATSVRGLLVYCADYRCSHNIRLTPAYVDRWPDEVRLSISSLGSSARFAGSAAPF